MTYIMCHNFQFGFNKVNLLAKWVWNDTQWTICVFFLTMVCFMCLGKNFVFWIWLLLLWGRYCRWLVRSQKTAWLPLMRNDHCSHQVLWTSSHRDLCRTKLLPVTHVLVDTWMLTLKPVYKHKNVDYKYTCDTITLLRHNWHLQVFLLHFFPVHPYLYPSTMVFTCPNDGWTGLCIKLRRLEGRYSQQKGGVPVPVSGCSCAAVLLLCFLVL